MLIIILSLVCVLVAVAYYVVIERKMIGMSQSRHGPNKSGLVGLILPLADGLKLMLKGMSVPMLTGYISFLGPPVFLFAASYGVWSMYPLNEEFMSFKYSVLYYMCVISVSVFGLMFCGWGSGCSYGMLGGMRAVAQSISYEVVYNTCFFCVLLLSYSLELWKLREDGVLCFMYMMEILMMWVVSSLAELNRLPFDFVEGESELVSGYMVEHGGVGFVFLVLGEYGGLVYNSMVSMVIFFSLLWGLVGKIFFVLGTVSVSFLYVLIRSSFPRYRYDKLMSFCWSVMLPLVSSMFLLYMVLVV